MIALEIRNILYLAGLVLVFLPAFTFTYLSTSGIDGPPLLPQILSVAVFFIGLALILFTGRGKNKEWFS
ncbi:MAG: hypothetical protein ABC537_02385 [Candidatus Methanosuratincola sp.]